MEEKMETTIMGYIGTTMRIHSFIPSQPKVGLRDLRVCFSYKRYG